MRQAEHGIVDTFMAMRHICVGRQTSDQPDKAANLNNPKANDGPTGRLSQLAPTVRLATVAATPADTGWSLRWDADAGRHEQRRADLVLLLAETPGGRAPDNGRQRDGQAQSPEPARQAGRPGWPGQANRTPMLQRNTDPNVGYADNEHTSQDGRKRVRLSLWLPRAQLRRELLIGASNHGFRQLQRPAPVLRRQRHR